MLKEFGQIARGMMFLHGHFTRPEDVVDSVSAPAKPAAPKPSKGPMRLRVARALLAFATAGMPAGVAGLIQIR
ncbi:MAG: hypothetical protein ACREPX_02935 [Rhodanobacteraceae bacterium]